VQSTADPRREEGRIKKLGDVVSQRLGDAGESVIRRKKPSVGLCYFADRELPEKCSGALSESRTASEVKNSWLADTY